MTIITNHIKWIMLGTGIITCSMVFAAIAPGPALINTFGASIEGPLAEIVVRSWGSLITLIGGMLIYGAYHPVHRKLILTVAAAGKLFFVGLILVYGNDYLDKAMLTIVFDTVVALVYILYLFAPNKADAEQG